MDLKNIIPNDHEDYQSIDLSEYELIAPTSIELVNNAKEKFIDITVEDDNSYYVYLDNSKDYILSNNCDGSHIAGLYMGFFHKFATDIIKNKKLARLRTPIVCLKDVKGEIKKMFFNLDEYKEYEKTEKKDDLKPHYYKGLGSWKPQDLKVLIKKYGLEYFLEILEYDKNSNEYIHKWLDGKEADARKEYLRQYKLDLDQI